MTSPESTPSSPSPRVCLVTGGNAGVGRATVAGLLRAGCRVFMVCRDPERAEAARAGLARETGASPELLLADLSSPREVVRVAAELKTRVDRLHVLVNNAAILPRRRETTRDGLEMQLAVNHLAYFTLTRELLPLLKRSAPSRIVIVASNAHRRASLHLGDLDDLNGARHDMRRQYESTKLMNVLYASALARRLAGSGVTVNSLHPGVIGTGLLLNFSPLARLLKPFLRLLTISPEEGARTSLHLALSPAVENTSGRYFRECREAAPSALARDEELQERLFERTEALIDRLR